MIEQIISDNAYLIHQKSIMIINAVPEDCSVYMSPMHFETILGNVIGNAIKYSYIDGHVEIHAQSQDDFLTISVKDDGIGIKSEDIPRIFDEFYRADDSRHERGSHGLGLTIAKRVVQMYHGTLRVESDGLGKGSVFYIQFRKNPEVFRKRREGLVQSIAQTQEMKKNVR
jgi:signal transduction histidine kinase